MERKLEKSYIAVFRKIKEIFPRLEPDEVMLDYERAEHNAIREVFKKSKVFGCFFHFTKVSYIFSLSNKNKLMC